MNQSNKHLSNRVFVYAVFWGVSYMGSLLALKSLTPEKEVGVVLSVIPVLAFSVFIYKFYRSIFFMDEVQIKIQMEAVVIAFTLGLLMLMTLGLLDLVITLNKEDWSYRHLVPYFVIFYFIGLFISKRKYNFDHEKLD
ncbi:MAG TPA: hypothetical protein VJ765_15615 [Chitinophagaceae bacterium]|nr:hypothetical protein [Chitinophagaceae bacterium]